MLVAIGTLFIGISTASAQEQERRLMDRLLKPTTSQAKPDQPGPGTLLIGMLFWAGLGLFWALKNDTAREFLGRWWWAVVIAFVES